MKGTIERWTEMDRDALVELWLLGAYTWEIAEALDRTEASISCARARLGLAPRRSGPRARQPLRLVANR